MHAFILNGIDYKVWDPLLDTYILDNYSIPAVAVRLGALYLETADYPKPTIERIKNGIAYAKQVKASLKTKENY